MLLMEELLGLYEELVRTCPGFFLLFKYDLIKFNLLPNNKLKQKRLRIAALISVMFCQLSRGNKSKVFVLRYRRQLDFVLKANKRPEVFVGTKFDFNTIEKVLIIIFPCVSFQQIFVMEVSSLENPESTALRREAASPSTAACLCTHETGSSSVGGPVTNSLSTRMIG